MIPGSALWSNIFKGKTGNRRDVSALLKSIPLFSELHRNELREIERLVHHRSYHNGEVVFWEDEPGVAMYVVQRGEVGIFKDYDKPGQQELARLQHGDFFGEMALLAGDFRQATAVATGETDLFSLIHPELFDLFDRKPHMGVKILSFLATVMAQRLRKTDQDLQRLFIRSLAGEAQKKTAP
jgi:CRP/FNR family cyclic AMP-dependent transcriptional regulator